MNNLTKVEQTLIIDLAKYADLMESLFETFLKPQPEGIYAIGELEPKLVSGNQYYTLDKDKTRNRLVPIVDINEVTSTVYNEKGDKLIYSSIMRNKEKYLSNQCFLPYYGIKILMVLINHQIQDLVLHNKNSNNLYSRIDSFLTEDYSSCVIFEDIEFSKHYSEISEMIHSFLENHRWNIYHLKLNNSKAIIERGIDWRVWCWETEHLNEFNKGQYRGPYNNTEDE